MFPARCVVYVPSMTVPPRLVWAYTYALVPPQPRGRLRGIKALLEQVHRAAAQREMTWESRLVVDERVSHILVLSESPDVDLEVNRRVEAVLRTLGAGFELTVPMAVEKSPPVGVTPKD